MTQTALEETAPKTADPVPSTPADPPKDLRVWLWAGLPLLSALIVTLAPLAGYDNWDNYFMNGGLLPPLGDPTRHTMERWRTKEFGFIEVVPLLFLGAAVGLGIALFLRRRQLPPRVGAVMLLVAVAAFYFLGEESSWGQHYLGWKTPKAIDAINRQHETNLHNNRGLWKTIFSTIPRYTATTVMAVSVLLPFWLQRLNRDRRWLAGFWYWVLPTPILALTAALAALWTVPEKILKTLLQWHWIRHYPADNSYINMAVLKPGGEVKEYFIALAMMLYLLSILKRLNDWRAAGGRPLTLTA